MKLRDILSQLSETQQKIDSSPCFLTGGTPRDRYLGHLENVADIDVTTGDKTISYLSAEFYNHLKKTYNVTKKDMDDGHSTIFIGNLKIDFSSNYNNPDIFNILKSMKISNPTELQAEMYSRDFTCNALLLSLDLKTLIDPTHKGFPDIKAKKIKTCLAPEITLTNNRNRVVRAIYLACKLDFDVDQSIIDYVSKNPQSVTISTNKTMTEKLKEAFTRDADKAASLLTKMNLWSYVPISEQMFPYYEKFGKNVK